MKLKNIETPALIIDLDLLEENVSTMKEFLSPKGLALRPHYKSNKSTYIAHMQIREGAKGITCAKLSEAEDLIQAGIKDVLIANQIVEPSKIARIAYLAGCCYLTICVDNIKNIEQLEAAAAAQGTIIHVLIEYEVFMNRCGVSSPEEFLKLAKKIDACPHLVFEGIQAYAGHLSHECDYEKRKSEAEMIEKRLCDLKEYVESNGLKVKEISGVSTGTVEFKVDGSVFTEIQAGSYLFMDSSYNALDLKFKNSLFLLTQVISKNDFVITDAGVKSISVDQQPPPVFREYPNLPIKFSEEHAKIPSEGINIEIGEQLMLIPSHCCTAINLHDFVYLIRNNEVVDRIPITSRGKSL